MQDFDFCTNLIKFTQIFTKFTQIIQILPKFYQICPNLLGGAAASSAPTPLLIHV